jgi:hypothetical protein
MADLKDRSGLSGNARRRFLKTKLGVLLLIGLSVGIAMDILWLLTDGTWHFNSRPSKSATQVDPDRVARERRARISSYVKPTVTAEMGDLGGKYFGYPPDPRLTRHFYIAAEPELWDFMPSGSDPVCGMVLSPTVVAKHVTWKVRYFQYTDATFSKRVSQPARLGILGPVLRAQVGEYIAVTFLNRARGRVFSMHPHGVKYDKDSEGSYHSDAADRWQAKEPPNSDNPGNVQFEGLGAALGYGGRFTYVWFCDEASGPQPSEPSSKAWLYHSHVTSQGEMNLGLEGFIIVTDPRRARPDGTPNDVDREMAAVYMNFDESGLGEESEGGGGPFESKQWAYLQNVKHLGERHAINGLIYGNLPGLIMNQGERVRWYLFGLGSEEDMHSAHWHGLRVREGGRTTDVVELIPASMKTVDMVADNPGSWLFHCHVEEHMAGGMFARVTVYPKEQRGASCDPGKAFFGLTQASP